MRTVSQLATAAFLVMIIGGLGLPSASARDASAAANSRSDGRIRFEKLVVSGDATYESSRPWMGDDIYNETGYNQTARKRPWHPSSPQPGSWYRFVFAVSLQNDGAISDQFRMNASGSDLDGWSVRYFDGTDDVSAAVLDGGFVTPLLGPGEQHVIHVKVTAILGGDSDVAFRRLVAVRSMASSQTTDAVKLVVKFRTCGC
jgi:hypothetical protein